MRTTGDRRRRWLDSWIHSELIAIPVSLAVSAIVAVSFALYLLLGNVGGLFVGKLLFIVALGGLMGLLLLLNGRRGETTEGLPHATGGGPRRVLVIANEALASDALGAEIGRGGATQAVMIVVPVVASSPLHALTDDIDAEREAAEDRLGAALQRLRGDDVPASGRLDIGEPMQSLVDGLREFAPTEVLMLRGGERGWAHAERFAEHLEAELDVPVAERTPALALAAA